MNEPVLDRAAKRFLDALNATAPSRTDPPTLAKLRAAATELAKLAAPPPPVERAEESLALDGRELGLRLYSPPGLAAETLPGLVYFHGGGLVAGNLDTHDAIAAVLAAGGGCRVLAVEYRLAPEARFPAAYDDAAATTLAVLRDPGRFRLTPGRIGVGGDSAGGQLAALAARSATEAGLPPALQFLLCPVMDSLARLPSRFALAQGRLLDEVTMRAYWDAYRVEGLDPSDPRVSPLGRSDFSGLPPAIVHIAEVDPLHDEGEAYALALQAAGVRVQITRHGGLIHHFYGLGAVIPAARAALADVTNSLRRAFAS